MPNNVFQSEIPVTSQYVWSGGPVIVVFVIFAVLVSLFIFQYTDLAGKDPSIPKPPKVVGEESSLDSTVDSQKEEEVPPSEEQLTAPASEWTASESSTDIGVEKKDVPEAPQVVGDDSGAAEKKDASQVPKVPTEFGAEKKDAAGAPQVVGDVSSADPQKRDDESPRPEEELPAPASEWTTPSPEDVTIRTSESKHGTSGSKDGHKIAEEDDWGGSDAMHVHDEHGHHLVHGLDTDSWGIGCAVTRKKVVGLFNAAARHVPDAVYRIVGETETEFELVQDEDVRTHQDRSECALQPSRCVLNPDVRAASVSSLLDLWNKRLVEANCLEECLKGDRRQHDGRICMRIPSPDKKIASNCCKFLEFKEHHYPEMRLQVLSWKQGHPAPCLVFSCCKHHLPDSQLQFRRKDRS